MNYSELINDYIDGKLDPASEESLFITLSNSEELRAELKNQIRIDKAFSKKLSAFVPSTTASNILFAKLGISTAAGIGAIATAVPELVKPDFFALYGKLILTGFVSALVTTGLFFAGFSDKIFTDNNNSRLSTRIENDNLIPTNDDNIETDEVHNVQQDTPRIDERSKSGIQKQSVKTVFVPVEIIKQEDMTDIQPQIEETQQEVAIRQIPNIMYSEIELFENNEKLNLQYNPNLTKLNSPVINISGESFIGLTLEFKASQYWQLPKPSIGESWIPNFYNNGLSALYQISDAFKIGAEIRNEHYYQEFRGTDELGNNYIYRQFPNYLAWTLTGRAKLFEADYISGFSQIALGATNTGGIGRLSLGAEFSASKYYTFILSLEGSVLGYIHQDKLFWAPKIGINYGIGFNI